MKQYLISLTRTLPVQRVFIVLIAIAVLGCASALAAQAAVPPSPATSQKPAQRPRKQDATKPSAALPASEKQAPALPSWPVNDHPALATVEWNSHGLRIDAANSSLHEILKEVSTATGATVSGLGTDQRVFGTFGPGPTTEVISELLDGTGYNVLMIGDQGQGTPRQIVLSRQPTGPPPPSGNNSSRPGSEDNGAADVEEPPPPQPEPPPPPPQQPQPPPTGVGPNAQPRTPQQILQEMQQRQQQIEQMQQQQQQQQQQQHPNPQ